MIFGRGVDLDSSGMVRDTRGYAYELAAQALAVGTSVCLVVTGERLEPRRDVEPEPRGHQTDCVPARPSSLLHIPSRIKQNVGFSSDRNRAHMSPLTWAFAGLARHSETQCWLGCVRNYPWQASGQGHFVRSEGFEPPTF
jgi:hypothetical protein